METRIQGKWTQEIKFLITLFFYGLLHIVPFPISYMKKSYENKYTNMQNNWSYFIIVHEIKASIELHNLK